MQTGPSRRKATAGTTSPATERPRFVTWTGWRGPHRDGRVPAIPKTLPTEPVVRWKRDLLRAGLGGLAVTDDYLVFGDRDADDFHDVWRCVDPRTGETLWEVKTLAIGELDYGNSPRATPLLTREYKDGKLVAEADRAFLMGAIGDVFCVKLLTGEIVWQKNLQLAFGAEGERPWGYCGSPLLVDGKLIVNPGASDASLVALDPGTGDVVWKTAGNSVSYGSFTTATLGGKRQIVGYDAVSLGGWDIETGQRIWTLKPPVKGDFNVPTPVVYRGKLLVATENNGTRLYAFDQHGKINPAPVAENGRLKPDMSTPVVVGDRLFCVDRFLYCLDLSDDLREISRLRDRALGDYAAIVTDHQRLLIAGRGQLLLVDVARPEHVVSRLTVFDEDIDVYSHAAILADQLFIRGESSLKCLSLK